MHPSNNDLICVVGVHAVPVHVCGCVCLYVSVYSHAGKSALKALELSGEAVD